MLCVFALIKYLCDSDQGLNRSTSDSQKKQKVLLHEVIGPRLNRAGRGRVFVQLIFLEFQLLNFSRISPTMPLRKASTQETKIAPMMMVTQEPKPAR